jgi:hypothetical protein
MSIEPRVTRSDRERRCPGLPEGWTHESFSDEAQYDSSSISRKKMRARARNESSDCRYEFVSMMS